MSFSLSTSLTGETLINSFNFYNGEDPSNGFVSYQSQADALAQNLYSIDSQTQVVRLGVDSTNKYSLDEGRPSIRLESKEAYNHGLFIADFQHMPPSQCGVWPAFWSYGTDWPNGGEIDIIEGANTAYNNIISAHTADGCTLDPADSGLYSGVQRTSDCAIGTENIGCGYNMPSDDVSSYGDGFNAADGGVYAMLWDSDYIRLWHFSRDNIPSDIDAKNPEPETWGLPDALFGGSKCNVDSFFKDMSIVININFCGDYGDATWADTCGSVASTCSEYVANNPAAFTNAYWDVNYIDVYESANGTTPVFSSSSAVPSNATTTTMTSLSTTTQTISGVTTPTSTGGSSNPSVIDKYSYLGCFGSKTGFRTFSNAKTDDKMTLETCVKLCNGVTYAGVFEDSCYCADDLDAGTRAVPDQSACDHPCAGDSSEFCGGLVDLSTGNSTLIMRRSLDRRALPRNRLLSVYAAVMDEQPPAPPGMATSIPTTAFSSPTSTQKAQEQVTTVTYTSYVSDAAKSFVLEEYVATLTIEDCGCDEDEPQTIVEVAMETKVVECDACGNNGENETTITVPIMATATAQAVATPNKTFTYSRKPAETSGSGSVSGSEESDDCDELDMTTSVETQTTVPTATTKTSATSDSTGTSVAAQKQSVVVTAGARGGWQDAQFSITTSMIFVVIAALL